MSLVQLSYDLVRIAAPIGHGSSYQDLDVITAQEWMRLSVIDAGIQHKLRRHHHQGHVTMPGLPLTGLILRHANMALRILKGALDPEALRLHLGKLGNACFRGGVAQTVFDRRGGVDFPAHDQMPASRYGTLSIPQPHAPMQHLDDQVSFGRAPQGLLSPSRRRLTLDPFAHLERMRVAVIKQAFAAKAVFLR